MGTSGSARPAQAGTRRPLLVCLAVIALALLAPASALGAGELLGDLDAREGRVAPTDAQRAIVAGMGAEVTWNSFGTPHSLIRHGGFLAEGVTGDGAVAAARSWLEENKELFRLASADGLALYNDAPLRGSDGHAVNFRQEFGGLPAAEGGLLTVGVVGTPADGWKIAYVSSTVTGDTDLAAKPSLSAIDAWLRAAANVGREVAVLDIGKAKEDRDWTVFAVKGFSEVQRARPVAVPTPQDGVRPAWETLVVDSQGGAATAFSHFVDAESGAILVRRNLVEQSHPPPTSSPAPCPSRTEPATRTRARGSSPRTRRSARSPSPSRRR